MQTKVGSLLLGPALRWRDLWRDLVELGKGGITGMVVVSTAAGMLLAAQGPLPLALWLHTLLGTALVAAGASALNQVVEREHDALMRRTARRPIPSGRMHPDVALLFGVTIAVAGMLELALAVGLLPALLAAATLAGYVFVYTPLKRMSSLSTLVGAVPGAMPPLIGWAAVEGRLGVGSWALFALLFFWQLPHFLAIAWMFREDYARGGFPMLPVVDPGGASTGRQAALYNLALIPVSLTPTLLGLAGGIYFFGALLLGVLFLACGVAMALDRGRRSARRLLLASVTYLPILLVLLVFDRAAA
jgi:protoheme IX farnesyltransferase